MRSVCERLPWDSTFFGFPVARVAAGTMDPRSSADIIEWCSSEGIRFLYYFAGDHAPSWAVAAAAGFRPVDIRVEMMLPRSRPRLPAATAESGFLLRTATSADMEHLLPIASSVHTDSRFFADPNVPRDKAHELFRCWLRRSIEGAIADVVFVAEVEGKAVSYISASVADGLGRIGLVGVGESARGRGIGLAMVRRALEWFDRQGARDVVVVTQGRNITAQRLYQRCGFLVQTTGLWFHRWFD